MTTRLDPQNYGSPFDGIGGRDRSAPMLILDAAAPKVGPFETFVDPTTGQRFTISDLTLAAIPRAPLVAEVSLSHKMRGPRALNKALGSRVQHTGDR